MILVILPKAESFVLIRLLNSKVAATQTYSVTRISSLSYSTIL
jgi:hypothetical protein